MTDRFMRGRTCVLALLLPFVLSLTISVAAADMQVGPVISKNARSKKINQPDPLAKAPSDRPEIVIGFVVDNDELVKSSKAAKEIASYLQEQLSTTVWMRRFDEESQLYQWLTRFREVDAAWVRKDFLKTLPGREFLTLVESSVDTSSSSPGALIAHPDFDANLRKKISSALLDAGENSSGRELMSLLDISRFGLPPKREVLESDDDVSRQDVVAVTQLSSTEKRQEMAWQERVSPLPAPRRSSVGSVTNQKVATVVVEDPVTRSFRVVDAQSAMARGQKDKAASNASHRNEKPLQSQELNNPPQITPQSVVIASKNEGVSSPSTANKRLQRPVVIADPVTRTYRLAEEYTPQVKAVPLLPVTVESPSKQPAVIADPVTQTYRVAEKSFDEPEPQKTAAEPVVAPVVEVTEVEPQQQVSSPQLESVQPSPVPQEAIGQEKTFGKSVSSGKRSLAGLVGKSEIPVLADTDEQFVRSMAKNPVFVDDRARRVEEADLQDSIRVGRSYNRESLAALARTEQAQAQTGQALSHLLPTVMIRANRGYEISEPSVVVDEATGELIDYDKHIRTDTALTIRQPLFDLPSYLDWQRRKVKKQAREEGYRASDGDAYLSTINAYLSLVSSRLQADVTREFEVQLADLLSYIEKRSDAGAASVSDMTRVRARSEATLSSRLELESAHAAAGSEFVRLTNLVPQKVKIPAAEDVGESLVPDSFDQAVAVAMEFNPEIAALSAELEAADIDQKSAKGRYMPTVDAEYTDTYSLHAGGAPSEDDQRDRRLMMVLNWELFSGGNDYNYRLERLARQKELQYRLDDQRRRVVQSLSANYSALTTTRERIGAGYLELEAISTASEAMSKRMLSGNQSLLDMLDVYNQVYQARLRLVNLHTLEMNTMAQLARLTHGAPWPNEQVLLPNE